jgi:hypothetical protein
MFNSRYGRAALAAALLVGLGTPAAAQFAPTGGFQMCQSLSSQTNSYIAAGVSAGASAPSWSDKCAINTVSVALSAASITNLDALYLLGVHAQALAKINLIAPGGAALTASGTVVWTAYRGLFGNSSGYYDTGINPATAGGNFAQNSAAMGAFSLTDAVATSYEIGNARARIRNDSAGPVALGQANSSSSATGTITSGQGDVAWSRSTTPGFSLYQNGIALTCASCAANASATRTSADIMIGSDGTSPTGKIVTSAWFGGTQTAQQVAALSTATHNFAALHGVRLPWSGDTVYVSNTAVNGIPVGNDTTGSGSISAPYLTLDKAISVANAGQAIILNDGTYSPATTFYSVTKTTTISALNSLQATLRRVSGQTRIIQSSLSAGSTLTLNNIILDGQGDTATAITAPDQASGAYTLALNGVTIQNVTNYGIGGSSANHANVTITGGTFTGSSTRALVRFSALTAGNIVVTGVTATITQGASGYGALAQVEANAVGPTVSITNSTANITPAPTGSGFAYGIFTLNIPNVLIANNTINMASSDVSLPNCRVVSISYDTSAPLDSSNGSIHDNTLYNDCSGGGNNILIGMDGNPGALLRNMANNTQIYNNVITGTAASQAQTLHGIELGYQSGGTVYHNTVTTSQYAVVSKGMTGTPVYYANLWRDQSTKAMYQKAGDGSLFIANVSYQPNDGGTQQTCYNLDDDEGGEHATGGIFTNNICVYTSATPRAFVFLGTSASATLTTNNYYATNSLNATSFTWADGTVYSTVAAWKAAHESTALGVDPLFVSAPSNYSLQAASPLVAAGTYSASAPTDFAGYAYANPPSVGAYQWH